MTRRTRTHVNQPQIELVDTISISGFKNYRYLVISMRQLFLFAIMLMAFGCLSPPIDDSSLIEDNNSIVENVTIVTCEEYCQELPHMECIGEWNISGSYPDCVCGFDCTVEEPVNDTGIVNETNTSVSEPEIPYVNKSLATLLSEALIRSDDDFYKKTLSGSFQETTYQWAKTSDIPGDAIVVDIKNKILFNDKYIDGIVATGFIIFEDSGAYTSEAYGVAIFNATNTTLDTAGVLYIDYLYFIDKKLIGCTVYDKTVIKNDMYDNLSTYYFRCNRARDRNTNVAYTGSGNSTK